MYCAAKSPDTLTTRIRLVSEGLARVDVLSELSDRPVGNVALVGAEESELRSTDESFGERSSVCFAMYVSAVVRAPAIMVVVCVESSSSVVSPTSSVRFFNSSCSIMRNGRYLLASSAFASLSKSATVSVLVPFVPCASLGFVFGSWGVG